MRLRGSDPDDAFRTGFYICALMLFGTAAVLAYARHAPPAVLAFLLASALAGFAVFFGPANSPEAGRDTVADKNERDGAKLVSLLQTLAIAACMQLMALCGTSPPRAHPVRRDAFVLAGLLESLLAEVGMEHQERDHIRKQLHRQTTLELLLPLADRVNRLIEEKGKEQNRSIESVERDQLSWPLLTQLESMLDMYWAVIRHISDTQALSLAERARLCDEMAEEIMDLKEWVKRQRFRRPHLWLAPTEAKAGSLLSDRCASEDQDAQEG